MKVLFLQGIPGSGKTTWAKAYCEKNKDWIRVSRDDLRNMRGKYWLPKQEDLITSMERACVYSALERGYNVIVDATNLNKSFVSHMKFHIERWDFDVEFETKFFDISLQKAIERDLKRPNSVGAKVIKSFYKRYINRQALIQQDKSLPSAVICDLDGTLAIHNGRNPFEYDKCDTDLVNKVIRTILWCTTGTTHHLIFMSGREDSCREKTIKWLEETVQISRSYDLYMRKTGDNRKDCKIKKELFDEHIKDKYYVDFILDDRDQIVEMWRDMGLTCLQVAEGDF